MKIFKWNEQYHAPILGVKLKAYFDKHSIAIKPPYDLIYVAIDDNEEILGVGGLKTQTFFEPLMAETPQAATKIANMIESAAIISGTNNLRCITTEDKKETFGKFGFEQIEEDKILMEKSLWVNLAEKQPQNKPVEG